MLQYENCDKKKKRENPANTKTIYTEKILIAI